MSIITEEMKYREKIVQYAIEKIIMLKWQESIRQQGNKCNDGENDMMGQYSHLH